MTPMQREFFKMSAAGNDFIMFDNRDRGLRADKMRDTVRRICARALAVGGDGVILLENSPQADVRALFFNPDGEPTFCGNGLRCAARLAYLQGMAPARMMIQTEVMLHRAEVRGTTVTVEMPEARSLDDDVVVEVDGETLRGTLVDTGVPHFVLLRTTHPEESIESLGRAIRTHSRFAPAGVNVDLIEIVEEGSLAIRTFERGVEAETLACGTGCVAAAVAAAMAGTTQSPVRLRPRSGACIKVMFEGDPRRATGIRLEGEARLVYVGQLTEESIQGFET
jgi:diaminopimelate epimerase